MTLGRAKAAGYSSDMRLYDITSAFFAVQETSVKEWLDPTTDAPWQHDIMSQMLTTALSIIPLTTRHPSSSIQPAAAPQDKDAPRPSLLTPKTVPQARSC